MNSIGKMGEKLNDKIKLFRVIHNVNKVYISTSGELFVEKPNNFSGKCLEWWTTGNKKLQFSYKNGKLHGKCVSWEDDGKLWYEWNFKNGGKID